MKIATIKTTKKHIIIILGIVLVIILLIATVAVGNDHAKQNSPESQLALGEKYLSELDYENAILCFEKVIAIRPKNARAYLGLAEAYYTKEDLGKAIEILEKAFKETKNPTTGDRLNEIMVEAEENDDVFICLRRLLVEQLRVVADHLAFQLCLPDGISVVLIPDTGLKDRARPFAPRSMREPIGGEGGIPCRKDKIVQASTGTWNDHQPFFAETAPFRCR